jgi:hypothetical protein
MDTVKRIRSAKTRKEREVWDACNVLQSQNRAITYFALGEQLVLMGHKRGSNSDIRRYLKSWKKSQNPSASPALKDEAPAEMTTTSQDIAFIEFYKHHIDQFDRLLRVIEAMKKENKILRELLKNKKPRVVCRAY